MGTSQNESGRLATLLFLQGMALGAWFVPLGPVLDVHGLHGIKAFAFGTSAIAALVSPLIFGALADRHVAPARLLRGLALAAAFVLVLLTGVIHAKASPWLVLVVIQLLALCLAPTSSLATSIVLARLADPQRQFGPIRALGTVGWMVGCWVISIVQADTSLRALFVSAAVWIALAGFSFWLPLTTPLALAGRVTVWQRLGLDALSLLRLRDHQVVFVSAALFSVPLAAFYPFTPAHLRDLGMERTAAWMSLGQVTEVLAMLLLSRLLVSWRLKWILGTGLGLGLVRYLFYSLNTPFWLVAGIVLHGFVFACSFIVAQVYLNERIDPAWRTRGQALFSLMTSGLGNLVGYLGTGWWLGWTEQGGKVAWPRYWLGLAACVAAVMVYFLGAYRGRRAEKQGVGHNR